MSVKIGHASLGSNGKAKGDTAGDQNGKEVCTRDWYAYSKGWTVLLRPKTEALAENSARNVERGASNNLIGYDQNQRNTLWTQAKKCMDLSKISVACETDCSAFMTVCAILGGANITYGSNAPTTSTMKAVFTKSGNYEALTDKKYLQTSDYLKRGDILVSEGHHTVMVLSNGSKVSATTTTTSAATTYPKCDSKYTSIVDALKSVGEKDTSITKRKAIAKANSIDTTDSATMNTALLKKLKNGTLIKA